MRTAEEIQTEIDGLKEQLKNVKGEKTECYTRIVGYYRNYNSNNWNKGKAQERKERVFFNIKNLKAGKGEKE